MLSESSHRWLSSKLHSVTGKVYSSELELKCYLKLELLLMFSLCEWTCSIMWNGHWCWNYYYTRLHILSISFLPLWIWTIAILVGFPFLVWMCAGFDLDIPGWSLLFVVCQSPLSCNWTRRPLQWWPGRDQENPVVILLGITLKWWTLL